ncbi:MAG: hypothetical protein JNN05_09575 [Candidatus Omnitrophica bacterium]|nr:hypothetical protein [Candidatus Omnitrophota bacterium]
MKKWPLAFFYWLVAMPSTFACPACAVSKSQTSAWQTFWILSVMGILPIVVFAVISLIIVRLQNNEKKYVTRS